MKNSGLQQDKSNKVFIKKLYVVLRKKNRKRGLKSLKINVKKEVLEFQIMKGRGLKVVSGAKKGVFQWEHMYPAPYVVPLPPYEKLFVPPLTLGFANSPE